MKNHALLALVALCACGGRTAWDGSADGSGPPLGGGHDPAPFVGTWTCTAKTTTTTPGVVGDGNANGTISTTDAVSFGANPDGTLSATIDTISINSIPNQGDAGSCGCSLTFSVSGSTATQVGPVSIADGIFLLTWTSGTFVVSGSTASITLGAQTSVNPADPPASGTVDPSTSTLTGTCTRLEADAGDGG